MEAEGDVDRRFQELRGDLKDGFREVHVKLDNLVTRGEHTVEVRRLDARIDTHAERFKSLSAMAKWAIALGITVGGLAISGIGVIINLINR